ncbi:MAG: helix-turn-helix transcriptional regulator [Alphaproteobacteria bacterium]|nr:helix-turn-helix transcriptional regulator [Alphaproteobacteria bacterium]
MFTHDDLWNAIEILARKNNMTCSGLARASGLDPTTFNKSKRASKYGQPRWLSMETISKVLTATHTSPDQFADMFPPTHSVER